MHPWAKNSAHEAGETTGRGRHNRGKPALLDARKADVDAQLSECTAQAQTAMIWIDMTAGQNSNA